MANSKVQLANGTVLVDLTSDTVDAASMTYGTTAHDKAGNKVTGSLVTQNYYTGSGDPADSFGEDGDIYIKV